MSFGPAPPPCPAQPWHSKHPTVSNSFLPFVTLPRGVSAWAKAAVADNTLATVNAVIGAKDLSTNSPLARLRHDVDQRGLALLDDRNRPLNGRADIGGIADRSLRIHAHGFCEHGEIDVRIVDGRADMRPIDTALIALRHALDMHIFLMPGAVVVDDIENGDLVMRGRPQDARRH